MASPSSSPAASSASVPSPNIEPPPATIHSIPNLKLAALAKFRSFTGSLTSKKANNEVVFPPPSWSINDEETFTHEPPKDSTPIDQLEAPEPSSFAQKIRTLIDSLPHLPIGTTANQSVDVSTNTNELDGKGPPIPDVVDAKLMKLLSSESVMNGDMDETQNGHGVQNTGRQSVWSALERLKHGSTGSGSTERQIDQTEEGVMMYSPLEPASDSQVELADVESELEYLDSEEHEGKEVGKNQQKGKGKDTHSPPITKDPILEKSWVPSTTQLSLFTTWWGYRLYLPPPVMARLNSSHLKTTKRAAMITAALKWFLDKIPIRVLPPQLRGAAVALKRLTPLVGYIGVFIAWSWTRISACDKGNGVVLTATWLLPVALIPMAWNAGDIYGPPVPPQPEEEKPKKGKGEDKT